MVARMKSRSDMKYLGKVEMGVLRIHRLIIESCYQTRELHIVGSYLADSTERKMRSFRFNLNQTLARQGRP